MTETAMESPPGGAAPRRFLLEVLLIAGIVALDQLTKLLVRLDIPLHESVTIPGFLNLVHCATPARPSGSERGGFSI
jgi:hypothetical protein